MLLDDEICYCYHVSMRKNVRVNREILAAWREEFGDDSDAPGGVSPDESPTRAADRTADLPVDSQLRLAAGFQNERGEVFSWGAQVLYADLGDAEINSSGLLGDLVGSYKSNDYIAGAFNFQWRF